MKVNSNIFLSSFPQVTKRMMDLLRDFAVTPSPTFLKVAADRETTALLRQGCARNISLVLKHKSDANFSKALVYSLVHILYSKDAEIGPPLPPSDPRRISYENILALLTDVACRAQTREVGLLRCFVVFLFLNSSEHNATLADSRARYFVDLQTFGCGLGPA